MSVEKRVRNGTVTYVVRWRAPVGRQQSRSFDHEAEATAYDAEINRQRRLSILVNMSTLTVGEYAETWLGWQLGLTPKTVASYRSLLDSQILPHWRRVRLDEVDYAGVSDWVSSLCSKPGRGGERLSPSRIRQAYHVLTGMLDDAVAAKWLPVNPARGVALPKLENRRTPRPLSHDQVAELAGRCGPHRLMVLLMAYCGLRWGEIVGLRVADLYVDRTERNPQLNLGGRVTILVGHTVVDVNGTLTIGTPMRHQYRQVAVPAFLDSDLIPRLAPRAPEELVFPSQSGAPLRVGNFRRDWFDKAARAIGLSGLTPQDLRHTAAALAIESGATIQNVQAMLGHKDASHTLHQFGQRPDDSTSMVADLLSRAAEHAQQQRGKAQPHSA